MRDRRKDEIIKLLTQNRTLKVGELANRFQVSMETIRRDLNELEETKMIRRVHGGAILNTQYGVIPDYTHRTIENRDEKILIGKKAAEFVEDGDCIIIDTGTTTFEFSKYLKNKKNLTVFTNSIKIGLELEAEGITVILIGGKIRSQEGITSGCWAKQMVDDIFVDKLFLGVDAVAPESGIMHFHIEEGNLRRQFAHHAKQVFGLADYSKFGGKALYQVCKTEQIDYIITDEKADKELVKELRNRGVQVVIA